MISQIILDRAQTVLQDAGSIRWPKQELLNWLSDAQREVVVYRPEACVTNGPIVLIANSTKQTVPESSLGLLDITRNMGLDGNTPGRAVRLVSREVMDAHNPNWSMAPAATEIAHFMFDLRDPRTFYVYPKPKSALQVEAVNSVPPAAIASANQPLSISDIYANALLDYVLYRCFTKDSEYAGSAQRAVAHYQAFASAIGIKASSSVQSGPTANSPINTNSPMQSRSTSAN